MRSTPLTPEDGCVWITGASSGIGAALARHMCHAGWQVAASARRTEALQALARELEDAPGALHVFPADVCDREAVEQVVAAIEQQIGPIAIAVLNAGLYLPIDAAELPMGVRNFQRSFDVNLMGTVHCLAPLIPLFTARGKGQIVLVSSVAGYGGLATCSAYGATKAALINMAECLSLELQPFGVQVTLVSPGFVDTPAQDDLTFKKPFMISADVAARRIAKGLQSGRFEICFPRRFTVPLKIFSRFVPAGIRLRLVGRVTRPGAAGAERER